MFRRRSAAWALLRLKRTSAPPYLGKKKRKLLGERPRSAPSPRRLFGKRPRIAPEPLRPRRLLSERPRSDVRPRRIWLNVERYSRRQPNAKG